MAPMLRESPTRTTAPAPSRRQSAPRSHRKPFRDNTKLILCGIAGLVAALAGLLALASRSSTLAPDYLTEFVLYALSATNLTMLVALVFARDVQPITVAIFSQLRQFGANIELIAPATFISLAIPLCLFFAFQRYFVQGLLAGSVK